LRFFNWHISLWHPSFLTSCSDKNIHYWLVPLSHHQINFDLWLGILFFFFNNFLPHYIIILDMPLLMTTKTSYTILSKSSVLIISLLIISVILIWYIIILPIMIIGSSIIVVIILILIIWCIIIFLQLFLLLCYLFFYLHCIYRYHFPWRTTTNHWFTRTLISIMVICFANPTNSLILCILSWNDLH